MPQWFADGTRRRCPARGRRQPEHDLARVRTAQAAIGDEAELYVDANGAYSRKQASGFAQAFVDFGVRWFEEPVSSDELDAGAVDVLQADATRCQGLTGFLRAGALCEAHHLEVSGHTAPMCNVFGCAAVLPLRHLEYFHDHVRIERMLFDGVLEPREGSLVPDRASPGTGLHFKRRDAEQFRV